MPASLNAYEIEKLFRHTISLLNDVDFKHFNAETDYYSFIPTEGWNELEEPEILIGSLYDDVTELKRVVDNDIPFSSVDLDRLASVLRAISQKISPI